MSLTFKALSATSLVSTMGDTDNLVIVNLQDTANPLIQRLPLAALRTLVGGGGGGGQVVTWGGVASQAAQAFKLVSGAGYPTYSDAQISSAAALTTYGVISTALSTDGLTLTLDAKESTPGANDAPFDTTAASAAGLFPGAAGGKRWLIIDSSMANAGSQKEAVMDMAVFGVWGLTLMRLSWDLVANKVQYSFYGGGGQGPVTTTNLAVGTTKLLVVFDFDAAAITVYDSAQAVATATFAGLTGSYWDRVALEFGFTAYDVTAAWTFNTTTASDSPSSIPSGATALQMVSAVLPGGVGDGSYIISSDGDTNLSGYGITQNDIYLVASGKPHLLYDLASILAGVDGVEHSFAKWLIVQNNAMGISSDYSNMIVGSNGCPFWAWTSDRAAAQANPPNDLNNQPVTSAPGSGNMAIGIGPLSTFVSGDNNTGVGQVALQQLYHGSNNTAVGTSAMQQIMYSDTSVAVGEYTASTNSFKLQDVIGIGDHAITLNNPSTPQTGGVTDWTKVWTLNGIVSIGSSSYIPTLVLDTDAGGNQTMANSPGYDIAIGYNAMGDLTLSGGNNIGIGYRVFWQANIQDNNIAIGQSAMSNLAGTTPAHGNIAIGYNALSSFNNLSLCTAIGYDAMNGVADMSNSTAIGANATVSGSNQVQLGDSSTTTYAYGAVQDRSDIRDKADVQDTQLGLDFILALRPVDFRWDLREDYIDLASRPVQPAPLRPEPAAPIDHSDPNFNFKDPTYAQRYALWVQDHDNWITEKDVYDATFAKFKTDYAAWLAKNDVSVLVHDGSKKRKRLHHGFIAQEVGALKDSLQKEFGGWQDHALNGGKDVQSLGYEEFIAPIVRSIQQLNSMLSSDIFIDKIASRVIERMNASNTPST